jgi:poly(A) polymerase
LLETRFVTLPEINSARQFAVEIVEQLRAAGHEALWAGGCVRDQLLGKQPKDYDVASSAEPEQVRAVFGRRRTLAIGAAFGVITVIGTKQSGNVEVATFRRDAAYSDGRHPDSVTFSTAEHDAQRRDFTINGLFYDPLAEQVIDYVGGQADLRQQVIRAIGNPHERFDEDKLRILRAVRFASVLEFELEEKTRAAIEHHARELVIVSAERIAAELRKMLVDRHRARAVELLAATALLSVVFPEASHLLPEDAHCVDDSHEVWQAMLGQLAALSPAEFPVALALLLRSMRHEHDPPREFAQQAATRLKLSGEERTDIAWLLEHEPVLAAPAEHGWPQVQRLLIQAPARHAPAYLSALAWNAPHYRAAAEFCARKLALEPEQLDPAPLLTGNDLRSLGLTPGPRFKEILDQLRDLQLLGKINTAAEALEHVRQLPADA